MIVNCPDCAKPISTKQRNCPYCQAMNEQNEEFLARNRKKGFLGMVLMPLFQK